MYRDDLVSGWIAQIGKIDLARGHFAPAGRVLDAFAAISVRRRLAIDRLGDAEHAGLRAIKDATLRISLPHRDADGAKHSVVELLGRGEIIGAEHYVCEHALLSFCWTCPRLIAANLR